MIGLPPLSAIRVFEAVVRHLNFTRAAEELGMTQAAVSYQIKLLEERVGAPLFLRKPRQVELSEVGARLAPDVAQAFELLRSRFSQTHEEVSGRLSILSLPTFASQWLAPNIGLFQIDHPQVSVRIETSTDADFVDFARQDFDVAVIGAREVEGDFVGHELLRAEYSPLMSPDFIRAHGIRTPADLLEAPKISPHDEWLIPWFRQMGLDYVPPRQEPGAILDSQIMEAAAAAAGRGFAMMTPAFFSTDFATGRLVQPFPEKGWDGLSYFLVYPHARRNWPKIKVFRDWIVRATAPLREAAPS